MDLALTADQQELRSTVRRWVDSGNWFGCNPMIDPLWSEPRFVAAMRKIAVPTCPYARPWPIPERGRA